MAKIKVVNLAKGYQGPKGIGSTGKLPAPTGDAFDPFFKAETVGKVGTKATIEVLGAPEVRQTEFSDAQMPIRFDGERYSLGLSFGKQNYARLFARFGDNPSKWRGKVQIVIKHFMANDYVAII
jgi:hypothetical protein